jgi:hypothetical protein
MKYTIRIYLESKNDVTREIEISAENNLLDLHKIITQSCNLNDKELASFHLTNDEFELLKEIPLIPIEENTKESMEQILIKELLINKDDRLIYIYDYMKMWRFLVELKQVSTLKITIPKCILKSGEMPKQAPDIIFDIENQDEDKFSEDDSFNEYNEY